MACWILGISALYHDSAAVLLRDGEVFAAAQEERFTRIKHDSSLPIRAVRWLLDEAGITAQDLDHLVFYEKPLRKFERILSTSVAWFPASWRLFPLQMRAWLGDKIWLRDKLASEFGVAPDRLLFSEHHLSHAASAFYASPHASAAVLTIDGVGEWATTALWRAEGGRVEPVSEIRYPHSLGLFYSAVTAHLGFVVNNGEYKVMGMASYGRPRFIEQMRKLVTVKDGGFELDLTYFCHHLHPQRATTPAFEALLGPPRHPSEPFELDSDDPAIQAASQRWADLAASAQLLLEEVLRELVAHAHQQVPEAALCLAGGVALNAVANQKLAEDSPFEHIWVQPAAGDAGGALGAALWAWHMVLGNPRIPKPAFPVALGKAWPRSKVVEYLDDVIAFSQSDYTTKQPARIREVRRLAKQLNERIARVQEEDARQPPLPKGFGNLVIAKTGRRGGPWLGKIQRWLEAEVDAGHIEGGLTADDYYTFVLQAAPEMLTDG